MYVATIYHIKMFYAAAAKILWFMAARHCNWETIQSFFSLGSPAAGWLGRAPYVSPGFIDPFSPDSRTLSRLSSPPFSLSSQTAPSGQQHSPPISFYLTISIPPAFLSDTAQPPSSTEMPYPDIKMANRDFKLSYPDNIMIIVPFSDNIRPDPVIIET